jgi:hypothetical protein
MHKIVYAIMILLIVTGIAGLPDRARAQEQEGYTFFSGVRGLEVCVGQYTAPSSADVTGYCRGQTLGLQQFSAVTARQSADRLDRIASTLEAIDRKLSANNEQLQLLTEVTANTQTNAAKSEIALLSDAIAQRFESIPEELISNSEFREELDKLKADIMAEVEKRLTAPKKK